MTVEDAEGVFGKRWSAWSTAEIREFVSVLTPAEIRSPGVLNLALAHPDVIPPTVREALTRLRPGWDHP